MSEPHAALLAAAVGRRDRDREHRARPLDRLGQRLSEGELRVEGAGRQGRFRHRAAGRRRPIRRSGSRTGEYSASSRPAQHPGCCVSRPRRPRRSPFVAAARPPSCQAISPHSVLTCVPSGLTDALARRQVLAADQRNPGCTRVPSSPDRRTASMSCSSWGTRVSRRRRKQVAEREHRVRLAAAEVGLQVDHWRGVHVSGDTPDGPVSRSLSPSVR